MSCSMSALARWIEFAYSQLLAQFEAAMADIPFGCQCQQ